MRADARANDEAVAALLMRGPATSQEIAAETGIRPESVARIVRRLRTVRGIPVAGETVQVRCGRGGTGVVYRIELPPGRVCTHPGCGTILRRGNPSDRCELHGGGVLEFGGMP